VRFREFSLWDRYKGRIIGVSALIVFQALIILYLLHQHRIRRRTEQALDKRLQFETLIAEVSSDFSNLAADKVDSKINDALSRIGTHMNVERSFLFRFNWEKTEFRISHLWEAEGVRQDQIVRGVLVRELFPWLADNLPRGKDIVIPDVEELSDVEQARKEYEYCRHIGIRSFLILPIQVADLPLCAIGLDSTRSKKKWAQEDINRLRILGEVFANTIARSHAEEKIKAAGLKYRTVADFIYDWEYWANVDGTLEYVSPSCERISGYSLQDFMGNPALLREIILPQDIEIWEIGRAHV
jgi:PAS domain-containing protein